MGWASTSKGRPTIPPITASPPKSPHVEVPSSAATRTVPSPQTAGAVEKETVELSEVMADVEAGMEEILPLDARVALLDYKPGDVVITPTGRGWHIVKVCFACVCGGF